VLTSFKPGLFATHDSRTLLIDAFNAHGGQLVEQLDELRRAAPRVWIIVLSDLQLENALALAHRHGVDAVLSMPFSMQDLTSRLAAFSLRARPTF
jgi:DNA-binding response OmpR family regulator